MLRRVPGKSTHDYIARLEGAQKHRDPKKTARHRGSSSRQSEVTALPKLEKRERCETRGVRFDSIPGVISAVGVILD
jgi:hypothetical protein